MPQLPLLHNVCISVSFTQFYRRRGKTLRGFAGRLSSMHMVESSETLFSGME